MERNSPVAANRFSINYQFDDFDRLTDSARAWDLEFNQLDTGKFAGHFQQYVMADLQIGRAHFSRRLEQAGASPQGLRTFVIPVNPDLDLEWRRHHVGGNDLLIFPEGGELSSISNTCFDIVTFSVPDELLEQAAESYGSANAIQKLQSNEVIRLPPHACASLRQESLSLLDTITDNPGQFARGDFDSPLKESLPRQLIRAIADSSNGHDILPGARARTQAMKRAQQAIIELAHVPITITELCKITGVSERTLQYAFQEKYGLSPKTYLRAHRLNKVRKMLRRGDLKKCRVNDLANEWGFWHMGQFAKDYRIQFGELPTETLKYR